MYPRSLSCIALATALWAAPALNAQGGDGTDAVAADWARGRALYQTACDACHTANVHWRDNHKVDSWASLVGEVARWQKNAGQRWGQAEIVDVAGYLNDRFYHLPCPSGECAAKEAALGPADPR
jgi:mono/diheme cytochrome c family protein